MEKPRSGKTANVPISETGTAASGISVARHPCRKTKTTTTTRAIASRRVMTISRMPSLTARVVSSETSYAMSLGNRCFSSSIRRRTPSTACSALVPGSW